MNDSAAGPPPVPPNPGPPVQPVPAAPVAQAPVHGQPSSGKATASMVLGIIGLVLLFCGWIILQIPSIILGTLAIVLGQMAKNEIVERPGLQGVDKAKAGVIMGIISVSLGAIVFIVILAASIAG